MVKHTEAKRGFVLLPRRWVVERTFGWLVLFRRLARLYERLTESLAVFEDVLDKPGTARPENLVSPFT